MENEPNPAAAAQFTAVGRKPRLIWQGKERRPKTAEPMPAQTVEIIRPFYANPNQAALNYAYEGTPDSRRSCAGRVRIGSAPLSTVSNKKR